MPWPPTTTFEAFVHVEPAPDTVAVPREPGRSPTNPPKSVNVPPFWGTLNFNHTSSDYVFAPAISGPGTVNVFAGTTILTAVNTYSGATNVNGGVLQAGAPNTLTRIRP